MNYTWSWVFWDSILWGLPCMNHACITGPPCNPNNQDNNCTNHFLWCSGSTRCLSQEQWWISSRRWRAQLLANLRSLGKLPQHWRVWAWNGKTKVSCGILLIFRKCSTTYGVGNGWKYHQSFDLIFPIASSHGTFRRSWDPGSNFEGTSSSLSCFFRILSCKLRVVQKPYLKP